MRIQEKLENLVRLVTGNKFGAADEYINQIKNEYNQMAHERDQYKEMAENEKTAKKYALKHAEKLDEKVEEKEKKLNELELEYKILEGQHEKKSQQVREYDAMFNQPMKLSVPNDTQVERLVPFSELERERLNFELLEKAIFEVDKRGGKLSDIFNVYHSLRQEGESE